ncbi:hypothetical protein ACFPRL_06590 [Pseudoclavibacter helvolus]
MRTLRGRSTGRCGAGAESADREWSESEPVAYQVTDRCRSGRSPARRRRSQPGRGTRPRRRRGRSIGGGCGRDHRESSS